VRNADHEQLKKIEAKSGYLNLNIKSNSWMIGEGGE
jgi:hypothetical protein